MKNIMIPTDFTLSSLNIIHEIVRINKDRKLKISIVHMVQLSSDISELLFSRKTHLYDKIPRRFTEAVEVLKNKYAGNISYLSVEFFYGNSLDVMRRVADCLRIDEINITEGYDYKKPLPQSVNMMRYIDELQVPVMRLHPVGKVFATIDHNRYSTLLLNGKTADRQETSIVHN